MTDSGANWEGLEARVSALEYRMSLEEGLRASQDRDLADLKQGQLAANHLLQALSITQSEHTKKFADVLEKLGEHDTKLDRHEAKLDRHEMKLDRHEMKLDRHEMKLDRHTKILDQHTKILDQHTKTLDSHTQKLDKLEAGQTRIFETLHVILNRLDDLSPASH